MGRVKEALLAEAYEIDNALTASDRGAAWLDEFIDSMDDRGITSEASAAADYISWADAFDELCEIVPHVQQSAAEWFDLVVNALVLVYQWHAWGL